MNTANSFWQRRWKPIAAAIASLMVAPAMASERYTVVVYDDVVIQVPAETRLKGREGPVDWKAVRALTELMPDGAPVTLLVDGVELEIGVSENAGYVEKINGMSRLEWLTFQAQMFQAQIMDVRNRSESSAAMASGDRLSGRHRVLLARSSWHQNKKLHNLLVVDVFHTTKYIGFTFSWIGPEGSAIEQRVDEIASSIESASGALVRTVTRHRESTVSASDLFTLTAHSTNPQPAAQRGR